MIRTLMLPDGTQVPNLGMGTWRMGERPERRRSEIESLQLGVELGMTLVDTAEMYGEGRTEQLLSQALQGLRKEVFLVSKVYPHNASRSGVAKACEGSLRRLNTDYLDLYLLHWPGAVPIEETIRGFEDLRAAGKIRAWGVSNFDSDEMDELAGAPGGAACAVDQILYILVRRGPEFELMPKLAQSRIPVMAYSPIEQGSLPRTGALNAVARKHGVSPFQIALAWVMRRPDVIAIPKAGTIEHVRENRAAADLTLDSEDLAAIDREYPPPRRKRPLDML
jgi:diketogulonate reductase-like aldo/keto reductase